MKLTINFLFAFCLIANHYPVFAEQDPRTDEIEDYRALLNVLHKYTMSVETADLESMIPLFHAQAMTYGTLMGQQVIASPKPYFDFVRNRPKPQEVGEKLLATITNVRIDGNIASAQVQFANHWCTSGANHLGLIRDAGNWKIIAMMFWVRPAPVTIEHSKYPEGYCTPSSIAAAITSKDK